MTLEDIERINLRLSDLNLAAKEATVSKIVQRVKREGDKAVIAYTKEFDNYEYEDGFEVELDLDDLPNFNELEEDLQMSLKRAYERIERFHQEEVKESKLDYGWSYRGDLGERLGVKYQAIDSVAIYIPGGQAPLLSTVLMTAIPAKVAGVRRIVMLSPPPINAGILAAAELCGVDEVYAIGGAQAIAAAAYGTESIEPVDKIVGPGNIYVSLAKKQVFGTVGIDGIYGPSELAIIADASASAKQIAADLLSQLEHGSGLESTLLLTDSEDLLHETKKQIEKQILAFDSKTVEQIATIRSSLEKWSALILTEDLLEAVDIVNQYAPEHLELHTKDPQALVDKIKSSGAIFIGANSCESLGDYIAGPSHCLPTGGSTRFSSGLQVIDFITKTSLIDFSTVDNSTVEFRNMIEDVARIARAEGLEGHARAMEARD
ncbi:MAG: histidinol dehydrogenase [Cyanobacteria bacterium]|nr:histidinol dehydrogenase [Cyanobacteriota bacterium]MDA1020099.1 histidinol dehydrogenase [Cyanobacteriota bacterium]